MSVSQRLSVIFLAVTQLATSMCHSCRQWQQQEKKEIGFFREPEFGTPPNWVPRLSLNPYSHVLILFGNDIARSVLWTLDHDDWICFFLSYPEPAPLQSSSKRITTHFPATVPFSPRIWIRLACRQNRHAQEVKTQRRVNKLNLLGSIANEGECRVSL